MNLDLGLFWRINKINNVFWQNYTFHLYTLLKWDCFLLVNVSGILYSFAFTHVLSLCWRHWFYAFFHTLLNWQIDTCELMSLIIKPPAPPSFTHQTVHYRQRWPSGRVSCLAIGRLWVSWVRARVASYLRRKNRFSNGFPAGTRIWDKH